MPALGSLPKPKAAKAAKPAASTSSTPSQLSQITALASRLPPSAPANSDLNPLADLVALFATFKNSLPASAPPAQLEANRQAVHTGLHTIKATFETLINAGRLHGQLKSKLGGKEADKSVEAVKEWLGQRWTDYLTHAAGVVGSHWDAGVRVSALSALMSLLRTESAFLTALHPHRQGQFATQTFAVIVRGLLCPTGDDGVLRPEIREEWKKWWDRYDDIRFHFLCESAVLVSSFSQANPAPPHLGSNLLSILEDLNTMPTVASELNEWFASTPVVVKSALPTTRLGPGTKKRKLEALAAAAAADDGATGVFDSSSEDEAPGEEDLGAAAAAKRLNAKQKRKALPPLLGLNAHRRVFQDAWLALLTQRLDEGERKRILVILHRQVLPHMSDPKRFMDWLVDCTDAGGTVGILALNGLFTLMQKHGLEFPDFFGKLYSLLDREVLHVRYRPRFFRLLEIFMGSSHLPSATVAAFIKRLARLSLSAPPAAIVTIIPFVYNLLKLHPACLVMIHRPATDDDDDETEARGAENDPFDPKETDPIRTRAMESSLWEIATLRQHYLVSVSGLAKIFTEVMSRQSYSMEDFLDHSYGTMFDTEVARQIRHPPALAPVPKRQPIGDSFFPRAFEARPAEEVEMGEEDGVDPDADAPVDLVSALWTF